MGKKVIVGISLAVLLIAGTIGYLIVSRKNKLTTKFPNANTQNSEDKEVVSGDLEYSDASGFSFKYPKSLRVEDVTPADDSYYSKLNLTKSGSKLTIIVKDEDAKTVDEFIKLDDYYRNAVLSGAITLAGISAKQYSFNGRLTTIALKDGILYLLEGDKDGGFWEDTQGIIASSFNFGQKGAGEATSSDSNTTYEAEEVVE